MTGPSPRDRHWTSDEDQRLLKLVEAGKSWVFISANLKRPAKTFTTGLRIFGAKQKKLI
jgi:hypothetical protein